MNKVLAEILALFESAMVGNIKTFYQGEVIKGVVPKDYMPALMVWGKSTEIVRKQTGCDQFRYTVGLRVVDDLMKYVNQAGTGKKIKSQEALIDMMEGLDVNGALKEDSVMGVLRTRSNIGGTNYLYTDNPRITYATIQVGDFWVIQAEMELEAYSEFKQFS